MGLQDVALLSFRTSFHTIFLKNCGRGEGLGTTTCLATVAVKYFRCNKCFFLSVEFNGDHKTVTRQR